jgi:hypothetical protein
MSRRLGRVERTILAKIEATRANRTGWSSIELGNACYPGYAGLTYTAERKALVRAIHSLVRKYPHRFTVIGGRGRRPLRLLELRRRTNDQAD